MKIVLTGVETNNKGAELMLYAILQEIERKWPKAEVYVEPDTIPQGLHYISTNVRLRYWPFSHLIGKLHINGILSRLHLPQLKDSIAVKGDYFFDGSGFRFSDQCKLWGTTPEWWEKILKRQYNNGAHIVFLPQAFGPLEMEESKKAIRVIGDYSNLIFPRDTISFNYLEQSDDLKDKSKIRLFPDFTASVKGSFPSKYEHLKGGICVIPNLRMIEKGSISYDNYISLISSVIEEGKKSKRPVYLLNHEGYKDEQLAYKCQKTIDGEVEVVTGLNALEVKGLISTAYLVITSRFHGLASALNSCVPSLATSWSHKYSELFREYFPDESIEESNIYLLPLDNISAAKQRIADIIEERVNSEIRAKLEKRIPQILKKNEDMWKLIWEL